MPGFGDGSGAEDSPRPLVVFSGGSATNSLVDVFNSISTANSGLLSYIVPISDNGGSSSELIRVFGGPGIGDVRSRLVRLIPTYPIDRERAAIASLFNHRLSSLSSQHASREWYSIVDGTSPLWSRISSPKKQLIRSFFNHINLEILKRSRPPTSTFDFTSASVGNFFLTGARLFSNSFESAIYLLSSICGVSDHSVRVIPAINSNFTHHIAAGLADGTVIVGQNSISHPSEPTALEKPRSVSDIGGRPRSSRLSLGDPEAVVIDDEISTRIDAFDRTRPGPGPQEREDANLPGTLPTLRAAAIKVSKTAYASGNHDLPARIDRVWYINPYGQEISPPPNPRVCEAVCSAEAIIYSIGSLYTSIIPTIVLRGVGDAIRQNRYAGRRKILILNGTIDREVGPSTHPFTAVDFVEAIVKAGEESRGMPWTRPPSVEHSPTSTFTTLQSNTHYNLNDDAPASDSASASINVSLQSIYSKYVNFIIHLDGPGTPQVDVARLSTMGISCIKVEGQEVEVEVEIEAEDQATLAETQDHQEQQKAQPGAEAAAAAVTSTTSAHKNSEEEGRKRIHDKPQASIIYSQPPPPPPTDTALTARIAKPFRGTTSHPPPPIPQQKSTSTRREMRYNPALLEHALRSIMDMNVNVNVDMDAPGSLACP